MAMMGSQIKLLLHGIDTVQCAYFMQRTGEGHIDFQILAEKKESIRQSKYKHPLPITLGSLEFLLQPYGTRSGYPLVITNQDFKIEFGEFNNPNFFVTFTSQALWRESAFLLHDKFIAWARSVGYELFKPESLSRVDFSFDYNLPTVDFTEDCFISRSSKDSQHREDGKVQTFTFGKGDVVLRIYDKVAEIKQQSDKVWFYLLWGQDTDVWRIEWQVRKAVLRRFDIKTFSDLNGQQGDLLSYLSEEHDTLRIPTNDKNASRDWPLHPLWKDLQERIKELNHLGIYKVVGDQAILEERMMRMAIAMYGYLKRVAAVYCIQNKKPMISSGNALDHFGHVMLRLHEPLAWETDVQRRIKEMQLGSW
jgi:hypothetical protein